jgi:hypothetical protein
MNAEQEHAFFELVVSHLQTDAGLTNAYLEQTGGGIECIVIPCGDHLLYFGTANETWDADIWLSDGRKAEFLDRFLHTECPSDSQDASEVALALTKAAMEFDASKTAVS